MSSKRNLAFLFLIVTSVSPNLPNTMASDSFGNPLLQIPAEHMNNMPLHLLKQLYEQASKPLSRTRRTVASAKLLNTMDPDLFGNPLMQIPAELMNNMPLYLQKQLYEQANKPLSGTRRTVASAYLPNTKDPDSFLPPMLQLMKNMPLHLQKQLYEQAIKPLSRTQRHTNFAYRPLTVPAFPQLAYVPPEYKYRTFSLNQLNPFTSTRPYFNWFQSRPEIAHQFPKLMMSRNPVFTNKCKPTRENNSVEPEPHRDLSTLVTHTNPIEDDDDDFSYPDLTPDTQTRYEGSTTYTTEPDSSFKTVLNDTGSTDEVKSSSDGIDQMLARLKSINDDEVINDTESSNTNKAETTTPSYNSTSGNDNNETVDYNDTGSTNVVNSSSDKFEQMLTMLKSIHDIVSSNTKEVEPATPSYNSTSDNNNNEEILEEFPHASVTQTNELTTTMLPGSQNVSDNGTNTSQAFYNINSSVVSNSTEITENTSRVDQFNSSNLMENYFNAVDIFDRNFYQTTFAKLRNNSAEGREENGISFAQSGLFLHMALTVLAPAVDDASRAEIEQATHYLATEPERRDVLKSVLSWLPQSSATLKFRRATRLVAAPSVSVAEHFQQQSADVGLQVDRLNGTNDPAYLAKTLNDMVERDSGGSLRQTFEEEEVSGGVCAALLSTLYLRASWRTAPTLLNQSRPFRDPAAAARTSPALRLTDQVGYASLPDWDAEAIEIQYSEPELSLLLVVPRAPSLRALGQRLAAEGISPLLAQLRPRRLAVVMPLYTLRMTLLLPNKLQSMGVRSVVSAAPGGCRELRLSHATQRVMFWAEAGRHAYKDDGIQWDDPPEFEMVVDRPYAFFVRWRNVTLMNGHFVL